MLWLKAHNHRLLRACLLGSKRKLPPPVCQARLGLLSVGRAGTEYREVHGGMGYGRSEPDVEGERILEYALAFDLLLGNTCFKKRDSHLITYKSGNAATQIDFILFPRAMHKFVTDVKVIPGEEVALQHQLLVCDMKFDVPPKPKRKFTPKSMEADKTLKGEITSRKFSSCM